CLGMSAFETGDKSLAQSYFERVLNVEAKGANAGRALTWLALLRQSVSGGESEAELLYQKALAALDPRSPEAANTLTNYARLVRRQNRTAEADQLEARAKEVRQSSAGINGNVAGVPDGVYRVGSGISAPTLLRKVEPEYSEEARAAKYQGIVVLYIEV